MRNFQKFFLAVSLPFPALLSGQVVINEIRASDDQIEIRNIGSTTMDVASWWICRFPDYSMLSSLTLVCGGDLNLEAGAIATIDLNYDISAADDELALYINASFGSSTAIRDYVEWGSSGHVRSSVAIAAGIWTEDDFVPDWSDCISLEYDGAGNLSTDFVSQDVATMPCIQNSLDGCGAMPVELLSFAVYQEKTDVIISWKSTHDPTASKIFLERSADGSSWNAITDWQPSGPEFDAGHFRDKKLQPGTYYYRLKAAYLDGAIDTYEMQVIRVCEEDNAISVWPNPTRRNVSVFLNGLTIDHDTKYAVLDVQGNTWGTGIVAERFEIDMSSLPPGVYFVRIPDLGMMRRITRTE